MTVKSLLTELRALSGIAEAQEDGGVDWFIPSSDVDQETQQILSIMGMKRVSGQETESLEEQASKLDASIKETVKGALVTLAKRIEGVADLVDMGKIGSVQVALEKIMEDIQTLVDSVSTGDKKRQAHEKQEKDKAKQGQEQQAQQDQQADKGDKQASAPKGGAASRGAGNALSPGGGGPTPEQKVQVSHGANEQYFVVGSELITESSMKDPFGLGDAFKSSIAKMGQIPIRAEKGSK